MKKLLLPLILLSSIPFDTSCIKAITFDVEVLTTNCTYEKISEKATMGHTYTIKLIPDEGYALFILDGVINVATDNAGDITFLLGDTLYDENTDILTIPGEHVSSKITITANGQIE